MYSNTSNFYASPTYTNPSYAIFKPRRFVFCLRAFFYLPNLGRVSTRAWWNSSCVEARPINLEVDSDDVQELLASPNQELTNDELIEMHEQKQDIEEHEYLDPIQSIHQITLKI
ncbi:hypothetical protein TNCV_640701 [Trichonephila clavipes]|nr:hypothetical protein TNCV_640701 [Trichonephila clavipes]